MQIRNQDAETNRMVYGWSIFWGVDLFGVYIRGDPSATSTLMNSTLDSLSAGSWCVQQWNWAIWLVHEMAMESCHIWRELIIEAVCLESMPLQNEWIWESVQWALTDVYVQVCLWSRCSMPWSTSANVHWINGDQPLYMLNAWWMSVKGVRVPCSWPSSQVAMQVVCEPAWSYNRAAQCAMAQWLNVEI